MIPHIHIIDADPGAAQTTRALVTRLAADATVTVDSTPEDGRIHLQQHLADVLIIDPSSNQLAAARVIQWLKAENPAVRVVVLTSHATSAQRRRMEDLGIDLYQEKHQPPTVLIQQLRVALHQDDTRAVNESSQRAGTLLLQAALTTSMV